jgi:hypothetical protein
MRALILHEAGAVETIDVRDGLDGLYAALSTDTGQCTNVEALPVFPPRPGRNDATLYIDGEGRDVRPRNPLATAWLKTEDLLFPGDFVSGPVLMLGFDPRRGINLPLPRTIGTRYVDHAIQRYLVGPERAGR